MIFLIVVFMNWFPIQIVAGSRGKTAPMGATFGSPSLDAVARGKILHDLKASMISGVICTMGILSVEEPDKMSEMAGVSTALIQRDFPSGILGRMRKRVCIQHSVLFIGSSSRDRENLKTGKGIVVLIGSDI